MYPRWLTQLIVSGASTLLLAACGGDGGGANGPGVIRGTIEIASGTRTDADTALDLTVQGLDSSRDVPLNGVQNSGSPYPGNVTVGGYVSSGAGSYGNGFSYPADDTDQLRLSLVNGQRVTVNIFPAPYNPSGATLAPPSTQLRLEPVAGGVDSESADNQETTKSVQAQQGGEHDLILTASGGGPARYVVRVTSLSQGETLGVAGSDILPGEAIVTMEPGAAAVRCGPRPVLRLRRQGSSGLSAEASIMCACRVSVKLSCRRMPPVVRRWFAPWNGSGS